MDALTESSGLVDFLYKLENKRNADKDKRLPIFFILHSGMFCTANYKNYNLDKNYVEVSLEMPCEIKFFYISLSSISAWGNN